jgi:hypothetical protein
MRIASCRSCGAAIVWAETPTGKMAPFDAVPTHAGQWGIDDRALTPKAAKIDGEANAGKPAFVSHFATCPFAGEHRRRP